MTKRIRSWLFIIFIFLFVSGTTVLSLYASGYKLNLNWPPHYNRLLIKTGMIIIDSQPDNATVFLDGKPQTFFSFNPWHDEYMTTAAKIRNVLPGEYMIRLERKAYLPWEKKIRVFANQATVLLDVNLFRSDAPQLIASGPEGELALSPNGRQLYVAGGKKIITLRTGEETLLPSGSSETAVWLEDSESLLSGSLSVAPGAEQVIDYRPLIGTGTINRYDSLTDRLYYRKQATIGYLSLPGQTANLVLSEENILAYLPRGDVLWLLTADEGRTILKRSPLPSGVPVPELELPGIGHYEFNAGDGPRLTIFDSLNSTLYLINPTNPTAGPITVKGALSWQWVDDTTLLYNNHWEIYRLDLESGATTLLTRVGEEIREIIWHADRNYLIFSTANSLQAYDPRLETVIRVFSAEKLSAPVLDADENSLYFWAQIGDVSGAYRLFLQ